MPILIKQQEEVVLPYFLIQDNVVMQEVEFMFIKKFMTNLLKD